MQQRTVAVLASVVEIGRSRIRQKLACSRWYGSRVVTKDEEAESEEVFGPLLRLFLPLGHTSHTILASSEFSAVLSFFEVLCNLVASRGGESVEQLATL